MPRQIIITPWRDQSELLLVREQLYQRAGVEGDQRREGVNVVDAWRLRGNLPDAVDATSLLVDATLHHESGVNSNFTVRAAYSTAFCRFVTGIIDNDRKNRRFVRSMYQIAQDVNMPASFVALRHEATHVALPNLKKLDRAAREALDWLWHFYWAKHGDLNAESTAPSNLDEIRASIKIELKSYSKQRRNEIKDFGTGDGVTSIHTEYIYKAILSVHPTEKWCADALIWNLVGEKMMFPSRAKSDIPISMAGAFALWDPLLQRLLSHLGWKFLEGLVTRLLNILTETPQSLVSQKVPQNLPKAWLLHILASTEWADSPLLNYYRHEILSLVMATCFSSPGKWTNELAQDLIEAYNEGFREEWDPILDASRSGKEFGDGSGVVDVTDGGKVWTIADKEFEEAEGHDSWVPTSILCMQRRKPVGSIA